MFIQTQQVIIINIDNQDLSVSNVRIIDQLGREIGGNLFTIEYNRIDVSNLTQGVYQLEIGGLNKTIARVKFIKL